MFSCRTGTSRFITFLYSIGHAGRHAVGSISGAPALPRGPSIEAKAQHACNPAPAIHRDGIQAFPGSRNVGNPGISQIPDCLESGHFPDPGLSGIWEMPRSTDSEFPMSGIIRSGIREFRISGRKRPDCADIWEMPGKFHSKTQIQQYNLVVSAIIRTFPMGTKFKNARIKCRNPDNIY